MALSRCYRLSQKCASDLPFSVILENLKNPDEFLLFESGVVATLSTADCKDFKRPYAKLLDCYGCLGILQMNDDEAQHCFIGLVTACLSVGKLGDTDVYRITAVTFLPMWTAMPPGAESIQKLLGCGTFYFAKSSKKDANTDLSLCAQKRLEGFTIDHRFFWNRRLHLPLQRYGIDTDQWLVRCICGGVEVKTVYVGTLQAKACLISRLSCERMGTRFNVRGVNDEGHVANFVETEQAIIYDDKISSFVQTRGSVPLFWEQPGVQVGSHKVKLSRGLEASAPAFDRHFKILQQHYGGCVTVNLLGSKEGERMLSQAFQLHHQSSCHKHSVPFISFDYHAMVRQNNQPQNLSHLLDRVKGYLEEFGVFYAEGDKIIKLQNGQIRTNCLDCLDRTNCAQSFFAVNVLVNQLQSLGLNEKANISQRFEDTFRQLWTANGDHCSRIYAGTGALEGRSKLKDASRSVTRTIQNNLMDGSKQEAMDLFLLGTNLSSYLHEKARALLTMDLIESRPNLLSSIIDRSEEFTQKRPLRVFCGTWNVNGGQKLNNVAFRREASLSDWLLDFTPIDLHEPIDIYSIGLEEIVDLNASNIVNTSSTNHRMWSEELLRVLCRGRRYILINSLQLVGVCLFVFVRPQLAPHIRDLSSDIVKTGLGGKTGNKGAVSIRFSVYSTSMCFVCSHFAAGQSQVQERNSDFQEICKKTQFPMGRNIFTHDVLFWMGDFNYRIDLSGDEVRQLIRNQDFSRLAAADQLNVQKKAGNVFQNFNEGQLNFAPTYKYDTFSDDYDTSEKCRSPAWTDRILWWERPPAKQAKIAQICQLMWYNRVELKTSDHRPVGALFDVNALELDRNARNQVVKDVVQNMGPPDATVVVFVRPTQNSFPGDLVDLVLGKMSELGVQVMLVKFVQEKMWLILADGHMALAALSMNGTVIHSCIVSVCLKSPDWETQGTLGLHTPSLDFQADFNYGMLEESLPASSKTTAILEDFNDEMTGLAVDSLEVGQLRASNLSLNCMPCDDSSVNRESLLSVCQVHHVGSAPNINQSLTDKKNTENLPILKPQRPPPPRQPQKTQKSQIGEPIDPWASIELENQPISASPVEPKASPKGPDDEWSSFLQNRATQNSHVTNAGTDEPAEFNPWSQSAPRLPQLGGFADFVTPGPLVRPPIPPRRRPNADCSLPSMKPQ